MVERLRSRGYVVEKIIGPGDIPDSDSYRPYVNPWTTYLPWVGQEAVFSVHRELRDKGASSLVGSDRMWTLRTLLEQTASLDGEVWELGVYKGGTALFMKNELLRLHASDPVPCLRLFDTFSGMPDVDEGVDWHKAGDFDDTSLNAVRSVVGENDFIHYHPGFIPETLKGLESSAIALAHVDVDIHQSVLDSCAFVYPRLVPGGFMVFDDYGIHTCPGARKAVDTFFADKPESPLVLTTGQAVVFKAP
ncbi:Demethyldecarbamoylnovobiocin O-methyltransferase [Pseudodesulfovibrio hydrargyri]|uniref:Demethyldecarbamoylnovobiocin O-methyltransferase n=2 Tax=Pseudodesulfovibrio hydrargyri TaxID=2125990 RepID=A0A1J5MW54_9BACT|nr:Demethyldecarbamoylnovobiocin O-methyltransferase [Pseudodesulfovibrio hydrargyri]